MKGLLLRVAAIVFIVAVLVSVVVGRVFKNSIDSTTRTQQHHLFIAQVSGCERQNIRQAAANKNALAEWRLNTLFAAALTHPMQQPQTAQEKQLTITFRHRLEDVVATLVWTPLNRDCATDPTSTQQPVLFSVRQPAKIDLSVPSAKNG